MFYPEICEYLCYKLKEATVISSNDIYFTLFFQGPTQLGDVPYNVNLLNVNEKNIPVLSCPFKNSVAYLAKNKNFENYFMFAKKTGTNVVGIWAIVMDNILSFEEVMENFNKTFVSLSHVNFGKYIYLIKVLPHTKIFIDYKI